MLVFGLFHGFGLATKLQELALRRKGLVANIVSFNVGVEIGQVLALTFVLIGLTWWRTRPGYLRHAFLTNALLMTGGFLLVGYQLSGYALSRMTYLRSRSSFMSDQVVSRACAPRRIALATAARSSSPASCSITAILPAEYASIPLGRAAARAHAALPARRERGAAPAEEASSGARADAPRRQHAADASFRQDAVSSSSGRVRGWNTSTRMEKGGSLVYAVDIHRHGGFDFHGEPQGAPKGYAESYQMGEENRRGRFVLRAHVRHPWLVLGELGDDGITVTLEAAGFVASAIEFRATGRTEHAIPE